MVKFTAADDSGKTIVGLGIEEENVRRLKDGQPIVVKLQDLGFTLPIELVIFYGATEADLVAFVKPGIGKQTVVLNDKAGSGQG